MSIRINQEDSFATKAKKSNRAQIGLWVCSGNTTVAEICASSGVDWLLIDGEHTSNDLQSIYLQLQAVQKYSATPLVRPPHSHPDLIKQYLDLGVQNLILPMVNTADEAAAHARSIQYPPHGIRGVGSALARASRWNRIENYLQDARIYLSLFVQIESAEAVGNLEAILAVEGIDGIFIGPSDLAASMGFLGQQDHPTVKQAVRECIEIAKRKGILVGVNALAPAVADEYIALGVNFISVGADVALLARSTEALADRYISGQADSSRTSY